jgi:hypothetical protein
MDDEVITSQAQTLSFFRSDEMNAYMHLLKDLALNETNEPLA